MWTTGIVLFHDVKMTHHVKCVDTPLSSRSQKMMMMMIHDEFTYSLYLHLFDSFIYCAAADTLHKI